MDDLSYNLFSSYRLLFEVEIYPNNEYQFNEMFANHIFMIQKSLIE